MLMLVPWMTEPEPNWLAATVKHGVIDEQWHVLRVVGSHQIIQLPY
jgi:hypothetical protein